MKIESTHLAQALALRIGAGGATTAIISLIIIGIHIDIFRVRVQIIAFLVVAAGQFIRKAKSNSASPCKILVLFILKWFSWLVHGDNTMVLNFDQIVVLSCQFDGTTTLFESCLPEMQILRRAPGLRQHTIEIKSI